MFGWKEKKVQFTQLSSGDSEELLADTERSLDDTPPSRPTKSGISWLAATAAIVSTAVVSAIAGALVARHGRLDADTFSIRHTSQHSPIIDDVNIHYHLVRFNGSLLKTNVFRQDFGDEVDVAWKSLGADYSAARVPDEQAERSGLASDQVKIKKKYGGGYPAHVEGLHHLHCLNLLRKSLAWNFEYYQKQGRGPFSNSPDILKYHITHCLDVLRQQLMCTVDVGVLGQVWYQPPGKSPQAFVDFNTVHKCRNFDDIRNWAEMHQLPAKNEVPEDFLEPPRKGDRVWHSVP